ncbi:histidine kinase dimerization/phosphoacceptor domain -containing protein [Rhizobium sp. NFR07]|uniref:sensor histidine kinase n=1 Tax=Rhizobium sp. NFR07 TaxID=1566262 RepID=UPI0015A4F47D|nr:histidine kinase dimerization/phosphoacceptor domain -containing protein [Rhizobium sp. NFR07]
MIRPLIRPHGTARPSLPLWLAGVLVAAVLSVGALIVYENYNNAIREGEARAVSSAHVVAAHMEWMMEASDLALRRIEAAIGGRPIDSSADLITDMERAVGELPEGFEYSLLDQDGQMRYSSAPDTVLPNHGERAYFLRLKEGGDPLTFTRLLDNERAGKPSFIVARRISNGPEFSGVASITIPNDNLDRFWASMNLGPNSTISVIRDDGWLIARRPPAMQSVDLSKTEWYPLTREKPTGFYHNPVSQIDGYARIVAFWKVQDWPLIALSAIERQEVLDQFWSNLFADALLVVPLMAILVGASFWIYALLYKTATRNDELEEALERNRFLLREIHHRVKNNLQAVLALLRLQKLPVEAREDMSRRIGAMIAVHEQIYTTDQFEEVEVAPYATRLISDIASGYDMPVELDLDLASIALDREHALPLGMIINEVVSNAFKYAFAGRNAGKLTVRISREGNEVRLMIRDDGPGVAEDARTNGMGTKLITSFVRQLGGQSSIENDGGAVFTLTVPLAETSEKDAA